MTIKSVSDQTKQICCEGIQRFSHLSFLSGLKISAISLTATMTATMTMTMSALTACHFNKPEEVREPVEVTGPGHLRISADAMANLAFATAELKDAPDTLSVMGKISPTEDKTWVVPARAAGRIESVLVASGETVTVGQPLARVFSPDFVAAKEEYLQSLKREHADHSASDADESGESDFKGLARMAKKKLETLGLSAQDLEGLSKASATDQNLLVRASHSGSLIAKNAIVGNQVSQGDALFTIADLHQVWFLGDVYPEDLNKVKKDQSVIVGGTPEGKPLEGKVSFISPVVDATSRTIKIRVMVPNPKLSLRADMYLQGQLVLAEKKALTIPARAILRDQNENYVFKLSGPAIREGSAAGAEAQKTKVEIKGEHTDFVEVASGINQGDQVVSDGALLLNAALKDAGQKGALTNHDR